VKVFEALNLGRVRAVAIRARRLQDRREPLHPRVGEEGAEALAHEPVQDVRVPVAVGAELGGGVVDMQAAEPLEADPLVDLVKGRCEGRRGRDVDAGDPKMARVEAEAQARMAVEPVDEDGELVK
jgi:hypothetical protein